METKNLENAVLQAIRERRSCRAYLPQQVTDAQLEAVLQAGTWAPSAMGAQSPCIVAVQDAATVTKLSRLNAAVMGAGGDPFYGAPTVLVVLADTTCGTWREDGALVMANLMLAAESLGLASCWIHRAGEVFASPEGQALLTDWGLDPTRYSGVGNCILGLAAPGGKQPAKPRKADYIRYVK